MPNERASLARRAKVLRHVSERPFARNAATGNIVCMRRMSVCLRASTEFRFESGHTLAKFGEFVAMPRDKRNRRDRRMFMDFGLMPMVPQHTFWGANSAIAARFSHCGALKVCSLFAI
jgi:hypothetical protein